MARLRDQWKQVSPMIRKPIVFIVGFFFLLSALALGWLPGPGGIPLFLVGIAILATEFVWAERIRDLVLRYIKEFGTWFKEHKNHALNGVVIVVALLIGALLVYFFGS